MPLSIVVTVWAVVADLYGEVAVLYRHRDFNVLTLYSTYVCQCVSAIWGWLL